MPNGANSLGDQLRSRWFAECSDHLRPSADGLWRPTSASDEPRPPDASAYCFDFEDDSFWFRHRSDCIAAAALRHGMRGGILDVGGGNGYVARGLMEHWPDVAVLEPVETAAANALERGVPAVACATLDDARLRPESVDNVGVFDVVEHIDDDAAFLGALGRALRPGGLALVTVPAGEWLWSGDDVHAGHHRRYDLAGLAAALEAAGLRVEYVTHLFALLAPPLFLLRSVPHRAGRPVGHERSARGVRNVAGRDGGLLARLVDWELTHVRAGRRLPIGTSLLAVARRSG